MPKRTKKLNTRDAKAANSSRYVMEDQIGFLMRVAMQRHAAIFMSQIAGGLTQTQFAALAKLVDVGICSQNHLGRLIHLDAATIRGVVHRLTNRRLVTIQDNPEDRRRSMVAITKNGRRVAEEAIAVASQITEETLAPLNSIEQRQIIRLVRKLT
jgi:DNA-binding MarR family transcriptional regulator